jgi:hypothetical protein
MSHNEDYLKSRLAKVEVLRSLSQSWLEAGDPDKSGGPSYWKRMEERLKEGIAAGYLATDPELLSLHDAFQEFKQQMWKRAGELLLKRAQASVDDARQACQEIEKVCAELDRDAK